MYIHDHCNVVTEENATAIFHLNNAKMGGAIFALTSNISFTENSTIKFYKNKAWQDGGAIYLKSQFSIAFSDNVKLMFSHNTATDYGGAIYSKLAEGKMNFNIINFKFYDNYAKTDGKSVYINVPISCNSTCLRNSIVGITKETLQHSQLNKQITTSPSKFELYQPSVCIDDNKNETEGCTSYYVNNIILGQEILFDACMYDYFDQPSDAAQFLVGDVGNQKYYIPGSKYVLISCNNSFKGIELIGNDTSPVLSLNYSTKITLHIDHVSEMKTISINLTVGLVFCHPGYQCNEKSHKCECYNASDIVYCPINYCNFNCCKTSNGYYHLSPVRDNQCRLHRSDTACGSCEEGYTLSFDSIKCMSVKSAPLDIHF